MLKSRVKFGAVGKKINLWPYPSIFDKAVKTSIGNATDPEGDDPDDNLFLVLYKDPSTAAPVQRTIYLSRHGESQYNLYGKIGGDSSLSSQGIKYSIKLAAHFEQLNLPNFQVSIFQKAVFRFAENHLYLCKDVMWL